jgi:hypothetical protein
MKFLTNRLLRRFGPAGRVADFALVGGAALKYAQRKGMVTDETARKLGASDSSAGTSISVMEMILLGAALYRILKQFLTTGEKVTVIEV